MKFEEILQRNLGKYTVVRPKGDFSDRKSVKGKLIEMEGDYFVEGYYNPIPLTDIRSTRDGKKLDIEIEISDSNFFHGGLLN